MGGIIINEVFLFQTESAGCKRSSIIKIREKGIVSRNVETFKPRTTAGAARFAASVGAAAAAGAASARASAGKNPYFAFNTTLRAQGET